MLFLSQEDTSAIKQQKIWHGSCVQTTRTFLRKFSVLLKFFPLCVSSFQLNPSNCLRGVSLEVLSDCGLGKYPTVLHTVPKYSTISSNRHSVSKQKHNKYQFSMKIKTKAFIEGENLQKLFTCAILKNYNTNISIHFSWYSFSKFYSTSLTSGNTNALILWLSASEIIISKLPAYWIYLSKSIQSEILTENIWSTCHRKNSYTYLCSVWANKQHESISNSQNPWITSSDAEEKY